MTVTYIGLEKKSKKNYYIKRYPKIVYENRLNYYYYDYEIKR